jgi:hypothetical protein
MGKDEFVQGLAPHSRLVMIEKSHTKTISITDGWRKT